MSQEPNTAARTNNLGLKSLNPGPKSAKDVLAAAADVLAAAAAADVLAAAAAADVLAAAAAADVLAAAAAAAAAAVLAAAVLSSQRQAAIMLLSHSVPFAHQYKIVQQCLDAFDERAPASELEYQSQHRMKPVYSHQSSKSMALPKMDSWPASCATAEALHMHHSSAIWDSRVQASAFDPGPLRMQDNGRARTAGVSAEIASDKHQHDQPGQVPARNRAATVASDSLSSMPTMALSRRSRLAPLQALNGDVVDLDQDAIVPRLSRLDMRDKHTSHPSPIARPEGSKSSSDKAAGGGANESRDNNKV
ncbi:hypothetical protein BCR37DRAFT_391805 [Protomyces lactucae-debilis]|uniref:Uncharacterized protein n=1 Tax=Protomyces lactucae-debilis TaxID=2754530 RepID=A0A1Y2FJT5_PROLT|nr:uncharacterized protein BCR37DRAFT_391805 [Protomyces lactucae-debilis]ORY84199.1 hypothetical protein BCR37DRAFT_391805 [Protomyces lactucae-debilis]